MEQDQAPLLETVSACPGARWNQQFRCAGPRVLGEHLAIARVNAGRQHPRLSFQTLEELMSGSLVVEAERSRATFADHFGRRFQIAFYPTPVLGKFEG